MKITFIGSVAGACIITFIGSVAGACIDDFAGVIDEITEQPIQEQRDVIFQGAQVVSNEIAHVVIDAEPVRPVVPIIFQGVQSLVMI